MTIASQAERRQILGLLDELLAPLIQLHHALLGLRPAINEANHSLHEATKGKTTLKGLAAKLVVAEFFDKIFSAIFQITGNRGDNFKHLINICADGSFPCRKFEQP